MANQLNYQSNIQQLADSYTRYTVSRIIANKKDDLLDMEVPADFSDALLENNIEVNCSNREVYQETNPFLLILLSLSTRRSRSSDSNPLIS